MPAVKPQDMYAFNGRKAAARPPPPDLDPDLASREAKAHPGSPQRLPARLPARTAMRSQQAALNRMPKEVSADFKWFVWNESWHIFNSILAEEPEQSDREVRLAQSVEDGQRSDEHFEAVQARGIFSKELLDNVRAETEEAMQQGYEALCENGMLEVPRLEDYSELQPPAGVTVDFYARILQLVHMAAATVGEQMKGTDLGARMFQEFEATWDALSEMQQVVPPARITKPGVRSRAPAPAPAMQASSPSAKVAGLGPGLGRQEPAEPLAGWTGLRRGPPGPPARRHDSDLDTSGDEASPGVAAALLADCPPATALCDAEGHPARAGVVGLWLESADFVVACQEGIMMEVGTAFDIGSHGALRSWPSIYKESAVLKRMLTKGGPCFAKNVKKVPPPEMGVKMKVSDTSLQPLQSFANARAIKAKLGYGIVKGWAIYDLFSMEVGEGYVAERYWWNTTGAEDKKGWVDFTPRPEGMRELVLAESAEAMPRRRPKALRPEQLALSEGLLCLRYPEFVVLARRAEPSRRAGTSGAVAVALQHALAEAEARGDGAARRAMASACIRGATLDHLSSEDERYPLMAELESLLQVFTRVTQKDDVQERELQSLLDAGGIEVFVSLMGEEATWIAATAGSALACACHGKPDIQARARNAGAPRALADLFERDDIRRMDCYAAEAVDALWQAEFRAAQRSMEMSAQAKRESRTQDYWKELEALCNNDLRQDHHAEAPRARRGNSWGRTLAFAQVAMGAQGMNVRRGTVNQPFVIWVLGAEDLVEGSLAEEGFFDGANWVELQPTEVIIFGEGLRRLSPDRPPRQGEPAVVRTASYSEMPWLGHFGVPPPDLAAVLLPEVCVPGSSYNKPACNVPELALAAIAQVPVVISQRFLPSQDADLTYKRKVGKQWTMKHVRCPFSTSAGSANALFDDNGWIFVVEGQGALTKALSVEAAPEVTMPFMNQQNRRGASKQSVVFWGILDIKYDTARPALDRVKVLETGDGQTSKFSHDGADIKNRYEAKYILDRNVDLDMQHVISADKKLTHDIVEQAKYTHLIPRQACFPRQYKPDLARQVQEELDLTEDDKVVLKLCNRTRAAGVVITPVNELDDVLEDLLQPPADLEGWFEERFCRIMDVEGSPVELGLGSSNSFEEQKRHWWSNESPVFVAEAWCKSVPVLKEGNAYDATMRVAFALRRKQTDGAAGQAEGEQQQQQLLQAPAEITPETLECDWLGGYWKLPTSDMDSGSGSLREIVVSAAKSSGTAPVNATHLLEVFASLDEMVQHLYGRPEPTSSDLAVDYQRWPELGAFLTARLGTSTMSRRPGFAKQMLDEADGLLESLHCSRGQSVVQAFVQRARGIYEMQMHGADGGSHADEFFATALRLLPTSANAMHLIGLRALHLGRPRDAVQPLTRSLLLDPDYKGVYINLGMAYLRLGSWERCIEVSEAGQIRHPDAPQFHYHMAVSYAQMALAMVNECAESTQEMVRARAEAEDAESRRADLEQKREKANEEMTLRCAELEAARKAREEAREEADKSDRQAKSKPIAAGTKLKVREMSAIFSNVQGEAEIGSLRKDQVVQAAGPAVSIDGWTMVPIEPRGAVDKNSLEVLVEKTEERIISDKRHQEFGVAQDRHVAAKRAHQDARKAVESAVSAKATIARRPASRLLEAKMRNRYDRLCKAATEAFDKAREHNLAINRKRGCVSPWLQVDDEMIDAMESREGPVYMELPPIIGWSSAQYRI